MSHLDYDLGSSMRRNFIIPFHWKYIKGFKNIMNYYQVLQKHQWNSMEQNREIQREKLYQLIRYASQNIPYYQRVIRERNIIFSRETIFDDLKKFPLLDKEIIRNHFDDLYKFRDNTYFKNSSGGSTGEPVIFYQDRTNHEWNIAVKQIFYEWAGRKMGEPMIKLWLGVPVINEKKLFSLSELFEKNIYGIKTLKTYLMTEKKLYQYIDIINQIKPKIILANVNSIIDIVQFAKDREISIDSPKAIMTSTVMLYPKMQDEINGFFNTPIFNRYGSREAGDIACNCKGEKALHLVPDVHFVETVDEKGLDAKSEEMGEIAITTLENYTMPLIRYKIGDYGILTDRKCACGRGWPLLERLVGRTRSIFRNSSGNLIEGGYFINILLFRKNIKKFQVVQSKIDLIEVNIVLIDKDKLPEMKKDFEEMNELIQKVMGKQTKIKYNFLDEITPSSSGKHLYVFSQL